MNLLNTPKYCFDPTEFEGDPLSDEEAEAQWQIKFICRYAGANLYTDLVNYHQHLLEKTLAVVQKEYEGCLNFGRQVKSLADRLNQKQATLSRMAGLVPKSSVTNLEELQQCLDERTRLEERRNELNMRLRQGEAERAISTINSNLPDYAQALAAVFLSPLLEREQRAELKSKLAKFLMDHLNNGESVDKVRLFYRALRVLGDDIAAFDLEPGSVSSLDEFVDQAKSRFGFIVDPNDRESVDIVIEVLIPHIQQSVRNFFSGVDEMTADGLAQKIRTLRNSLVTPLEGWLDVKLGHFFNSLLSQLNLSPSLYRSVRQAEMQRKLEETIVHSKRSQNEIHIERCSQYCCAAYNVLIDSYRLCCLEDNDLTDLRSCLIPLTSRYCQWIKEEYRRWKGDTSQCLRLSIKNWTLVSDCCECLKRNDTVEQLLRRRLQGMFKDILKSRMVELLCNAELFSAVESLPTILVRRQGMKDEVKAQQYVDEAFVLVGQWFPLLHADLSEFVVAELGQTYLQAIQRAMQAVDQVRSGLAKLRKSKRDGVAEQDSRIALQLKSDVRRFVENVKRLYATEAIPTGVRTSLVALCKCVNLDVAAI